MDEEPQPSTSKIPNKQYNFNKRPLTDAELLEIIENFTFEDIPEDSNMNTDIESDSENNDDIINEKIQENFNKENGGVQAYAAIIEEVDNPIDEEKIDDPVVAEEHVDPRENFGKEGGNENVDQLAEKQKSLVKNSQKSQSKRGETIDRKWKKKEVVSSIPNYQYPEGCIEDNFVGCETATDMFVTVITPILENIVEQSNLYAVQRHKILYTNKDELLVFIGLNMIMGYHKLPNWRHYWSTSTDLGVPLISSTMSRDRFDATLSNLHVNDNTQMPNNNKDKLYKIRLMIDTLNKSFTSLYNGTRMLSVDESMIIFKGHSSLKQYNPMKPIKRGYKIWCLSDQKGYIKNFQIYEGKNQIVQNKYSTFGLGERVVLSLSEPEWGKNRMLFFDNYFTSLPLLEKLKAEQTLACGTIRSDRTGLPKNMIDSKALKRGDYDYRFSSLDVGVWKWQDNKTVYLASNYHGSEEISVQRTQKDGSKLAIPAPMVVKDYNKYMGGVDHADRLRAVYGVDRRSKKWWHRLFWGLIDMAFVNAYVIYSEINNKQPLLEFRRSVSMGLITQKRCGTNKKRSSVVTNISNKKRRGHGYSISSAVRLSNRGAHWVTFDKNRGRCEVCSKQGIQSKPLSKCSTCRVSLCCNATKNCFLEFHQVAPQK